MRAARLSLLLSYDTQLVSYWYKDFIHRDFEEASKCVKIIYCGKALTSLPFVDCLGFFKTKVFLKISDGQPSLKAKASNVLPRSCHVDYGVLLPVQQHHPLF